MSDYESLRADAENEKRDLQDEQDRIDAGCDHSPDEPCDCIQMHREAQEERRDMERDFARSRGL